MFLHGAGYVCVAVDLGATLCHKEGARSHLARVKLDVLHIHILRAAHFGFNTFYYIF